MSEEAADERAWRWRAGVPATRFRGPVELYWKGLGYSLAWKDDTLSGQRDLDGQHREFAAAVRDVGDGVVEVRTRVRFDGTPSGRRPGEFYRPAELIQRLGQALARGFGPSIAPP